MGVEQQFIGFATLLESNNQNGHGDIMGRNDSRSGFIGTTPRRGFTDLSGEPAIVKIKDNAVDGTAGTTGNGPVDGTAGTTGNGPGGEFEVEPVISSKLGYNDWLASYGTDTDKMYNEGAGRLNYELQTWAAGYGARAEKLSQMGLSNSGVSDIYGANAYSAYVSAMNDLYLSKIEMDEANRRNYQEYSNKYDSDLNTAATEAYAYGLALYDGNNISTVETMMKNAGYSDEAVAVAVSRLTAVDASMLPVLKEQETKINEAFTTYMNSYTPANATAITNALTGGGRLTEEEAAKVIERLNEYYNSLPDDMKPDNVAGNDTVDENKIIEDAAVSIAQNIFTNDETGESTYQGTEVQKNYIRQLMKLSENSDIAPYSEKIIAKMDEDLIMAKKAEANTISADYATISINKQWLSDSKTATANNYIGTLEQYKKLYGANSQEYKDILAAASSTIKDYILKATDDIDMLEQAGAWIGAEDWTFGESNQDKIAASRINAIMDEVGKLHKKGYVTYDDYNAIIDEWLKEQVDLAVDETALHELGQILGQLECYLSAGYMDAPMYQAKLKEISKKVTITNVLLVDNIGETLTTPDGNVIPLSVNIFTDIVVNDSSKSSRWGMPAIHVSALYNDDKEIESLESELSQKYANGDITVLPSLTPMVYEGNIYFCSKSMDLYMVNGDSSFERDGKKQTQDQKGWMLEIIKESIEQQAFHQNNLY